jgi:hypothetical protein
VRSLLLAGCVSVSVLASASAQQPDPQWIQQQLDATQRRIQQLERGIAVMEASKPQASDPFATKWPPELHQTEGNVQ